jgi:hypothetical protein
MRLDIEVEIDATSGEVVRAEEQGDVRDDDQSDQDEDNHDDDDRNRDDESEPRATRGPIDQSRVYRRERG